MAMSELKKKLNRIAKLVNETDALLKAQHGKNAYLYFEAEGSVYAMAEDDERSDTNATERQKLVLEKSRHCNFDCGAW